MVTQAMVLQEILAATDFSRQSDQAFEAALALAQHFNARLHVLNVVSDVREQRSAREKLDALAADDVKGLKIVKAVAIGQAASEIVKYAEREKIALIVLGTHGRSGLARVLMGSVAEAVVRTAPCQVLTIGPKAEVPQEAVEPVPVLPPPGPSRCLVCAKESEQTICDSCKAHIQGEAVERKRKDEQAGRRGLST